VFLANPDLAYANQFHLMRFTNGAFHVCLEALYKVRTTTQPPTIKVSLFLMRVCVMRVSSRVRVCGAVSWCVVWCVWCVCACAVD
jgi:hypothetical protein